jgi:hypothetical protein
LLRDRAGQGHALQVLHEQSAGLRAERLARSRSVDKLVRYLTQRLAHALGSKSRRDTTTRRCPARRREGGESQRFLPRESDPKRAESRA